MALEPAARADRDPSAVHDAGDSAAGIFLHLRRRREPEPPRSRASHEALRDDVDGQLVERRREPQGLVRAERSERNDTLDLRGAARHGARLVEEHRPRIPEPFEHARALHDHAGFGGP